MRFFKIVFLVGLACFANAMAFCANDDKTYMMNLYGENEVITGEYADSLAVTCNNGIFVGTQPHGISIYKGIPYAQQPVGDLRWRPAAEARHNSAASILLWKIANTNRMGFRIGIILRTRRRLFVFERLDPCE